jgi:hypothetical protein
MPLAMGAPVRGRRAKRPQTPVERIAGEIMTYLDQHPQAADTVAGIRRWWLSTHSATADESIVSEALAALQAGGLVKRTSLSGGTELYARVEAEDHRVLALGRKRSTDGD